MLDKKTVGNIVRNQRKAKELKQMEVSFITKLSRNYISDIENGRYMPSVDTLVKLSLALDIDLNRFKRTEIQVT